MKKKVKKIKSNLELLLEDISTINPDAKYPTDMKSAIIGYVERIGMTPVILLDKDKCLSILMTDGMTYEEAIEFFDYNTFGAIMGEGTPCFATLCK